MDTTRALNMIDTVTLHFLVAYGVSGDSHAFGIRLADLHPHNVGIFL